MIKSKIRQKQFYQEQQIPSPAFVITEELSDLSKHVSFLPAVHKIAEGGYDGRGVQIINKPDDIQKGFDAPSVLEKKLEIDREIAIMVAMNEKGETAIFPPVEMIADPYLNLLDYQLCPAAIEEKIFWKVEAIAIRLLKAMKSPGLFAVEMIIDRSGEVWVNETAPRVHNSGHHTIEAHYTSQYDMLWRIILGYPLGHTAAIKSSVLINLVGATGFSGPAKYDGIDKVMAMEGAYVHTYGKAETRPGRKMGHVTVLGTDRIDLIRKAKLVKENLKVVSE